jgi:hypothetical protein
MVQRMGWITNRGGTGLMQQQRVESAVATAEAQAIEFDRIQREHRDAMTAYRLEMALAKVPEHLR